MRQVFAVGLFKKGSLQSQETVAQNCTEDAMVMPAQALTKISFDSRLEWLNVGLASA